MLGGKISSLYDSAFFFKVPALNHRHVASQKPEIISVPALTTTEIISEVP